MKVLLYTLTILVCILAISCEKNNVDADEQETYVLFNYQKDEYAKYVMVAYSEEKNKVVAYPDSSLPFTLGLNYRARKCSNGYYLTDTYVSSKSEFRGYITDITGSEYKEIWKATDGKDIRDTLTSRIVDKNAYKEVYKIISPRDTVIFPTTDLNLDNLNDMIESGKFFTYEGVEKVK
ncbi:MAG: hypothetical protein MJ197_03480 [Bacteroidales bacterium]|nr:hypothetical protein [Bacteroidales bacterium]